jgi:hypothetical protein
VLAGTAVFAAKPPATTFVAVMTADDEVPHCGPSTNAARGVATFHVTDETTGTVEWKLVANNLPGDIIAAHIHIAPVGVAGPIVQPLPPTPGEENGVIATGTFSNTALVAAIRAHPENYYVNVHSTVCTSGVIRGQLDEHGPLNN